MMSAAWLTKGERSPGPDPGPATPATKWSPIKSGIAARLTFLRRSPIKSGTVSRKLLTPPSPAPRGTARPPVAARFVATPILGAETRGSAPSATLSPRTGRDAKAFRPAPARPQAGASPPPGRGPAFVALGTTVSVGTRPASRGETRCVSLSARTREPGRFTPPPPPSPEPHGTARPSPSPPIPAKSPLPRCAKAPQRRGTSPSPSAPRG